MTGTSTTIENVAGIAAYVETVRMFDFLMEEEQCWLDSLARAVAVDADCFDRTDTDLDMEDIEM